MRKKAPGGIQHHTGTLPNETDRAFKSVTRSSLPPSFRPGPTSVIDCLLVALRLVVESGVLDLLPVDLVLRESIRRVPKTICRRRRVD